MSNCRFCDHSRQCIGIRKTDVQMIKAVILGTLGFLLYFIYDINSVIWKNSVLQKFFAAGSLCVVISALGTLGMSLKDGGGRLTALLGFAAGALLFLVLLIYTLFFALPFEETYVEESKERLAYTEGVYGLCRHPGVLWFAGVYLCLWGVSGELSQGIYFISMIFWNYLYVVFQDLWTFPKTFTNYREYKKKTPFLIPNGRSIQACLTCYKKGNRN